MLIAKLSNLRKSLSNPNNLTRQVKGITTMATVISRNSIIQTPRANPQTTIVPPTPTLLPLIKSENTPAINENPFQRMKRNDVAITISALIAAHPSITSTIVLVNLKLQPTYILGHRPLVLVLAIPLLNTRIPDYLRENGSLQPLCGLFLQPQPSTHACYRFV